MRRAASQLHQAVRDCDLETVRRLLDRRVPVDASSVDGTTPLIRAAEGNHLEIARLLLAAGADVNHTTTNGWTALMVAATRGFHEMVALLLEHGADATIAQDTQRTALILALERQYSRTPDENPRQFEAAIELLMAAQPGSLAIVAEWRAANERAETRWLRSFRRLYHLMEHYESQELFQGVVRPYIPGAVDSVAELQQYRRLNSEGNPYEPDFDGLMQLYALNRVNDFLLLGFQIGSELDWDAPFESKEYRDYMRRVGYDTLCDWEGPGVTWEQYLEFFQALGFESFGELPFSPFFHEVVEVGEDQSCGDRVLVERVFWPGVMFGDMLFSRAGVRVRCSRAVMRKEIAERSRLYFTFWRRRRETEDLSHGWGSNSQWGTRFHRSYRAGDTLHYNVDGDYYLDDRYAEQRRAEDPEWEPDDLTLAERIEVLTHRCFVRTDKLARDRWPYDDRYAEPVPVR